MPRVSAVSGSSTVWRMRRKPIPSTVFPCVLLKPIGLFTRVTFNRFDASFAAAFFAMLCLEPCALCLVFPFAPVSGPRQLALFLAAEPCHLRRILQLHQSRERRAHDVVRICRAKRLRQHVLNA